MHSTTPRKCCRFLILVLVFGCGGGRDDATRVSSEKTPDSTSVPTLSFQIDRSKTEAEIPMMHEDQLRIREGEFARLSHIPTLEKVKVHRAIVEEGSIEQLEHLEHLENMVFFESKVPRGEIQSLRRLNHLVELSLHSSPLPSGCAEELVALVNLRFLDLTGTKLTRSEVDQIRSSLPNTKIVVD